MKQYIILKILNGIVYIVDFFFILKANRRGKFNTVVYFLKYIRFVPTIYSR